MKLSTFLAALSWSSFYAALWVCFARREFDGMGILVISVSFVLAFIASGLHNIKQV